MRGLPLTRDSLCTPPNPHQHLRSHLQTPPRGIRTRDTHKKDKAFDEYDSITRNHDSNTLCAISDGDNMAQPCTWYVTRFSPRQDMWSFNP